MRHAPRHDLPGRHAPSTGVDEETGRKARRLHLGVVTGTVGPRTRGTSRKLHDLGGRAAAIVRWRGPDAAGHLPIPGGSVPEIRPFRALRYDRASIADPALVVAPPYDVIGADEHERLLARHPANIVRLDRPVEEPGDA